MAIEIQELHIRINVDDHPQTEDTHVMTEENRERIIAEAVEKTMEILSAKEER